MVVPTPDGVLNPLVLLPHGWAGVDENLPHRRGAGVASAGPIGTTRSRPSTRITGPATAYVACRETAGWFGKVGIDMIARAVGNSCESRMGINDADWIALDLLSQAEHDESGPVDLIPTGPAWARAAIGCRKMPDWNAGRRADCGHQLARERGD